MSRSVKQDYETARANPARAQVDSTHCVECDHPGNHHDAGECWTDARGREVSGGSVCGCGWYTPRYAVTK